MGRNACRYVFDSRGHLENQPAYGETAILDVDAVHRRYGKQLTFDGCIGTQSTMPFGSPEDVRKRVREVIDRYGRDGGLIVSPTHVLEPEVPLANIDALFEACHAYSRG